MASAKTDPVTDGESAQIQGKPTSLLPDGEKGASVIDGDEKVDGEAAKSTSTTSMGSGATESTLEQPKNDL